MAKKGFRISKEIKDETIERIKNKESKLLDLVLEGKIADDSYEKKLQSMKLEIISLEQQIEKTRVNIKQELATFEHAKNALKTLQGFTLAVSEKNPSKKRIILFEVLSNMTLKDRKVLNLQQKSPYSVIINRGKNASFSEMLPG